MPGQVLPSLQTSILAERLPGSRTLVRITTAWSLTGSVVGLATGVKESWPAVRTASRPGVRRADRPFGRALQIAQLDGSDIVYVARVAVPKIIALAVAIGTRFPAMQTSLGKVLLAALPPAEAERVLAEPSRSGITARWQRRCGVSADWAASQASPQVTVFIGRAAS